MLMIKNGRIFLNGVDISDKPMLNYLTADGKYILKPTMAEKRENWVDVVDEDNGLCEVYFHGELQCFIRWYAEAKKYLQYLVDEEDYYNGNEKVDEFEF